MCGPSSAQHHHPALACATRVFRHGLLSREPCRQPAEVEEGVLSEPRTWTNEHGDTLSFYKPKPPVLSLVVAS